MGGEDTPDFGGNPEDVGTVPASPAEDVKLSGYAQNFLNQIPEDHRPVVQQYLPKWDAGFTQYSQRVQQELGRYKSLGDPETLQMARTLYERVTTNPDEVAEFLISQGYGPKQAKAAAEAATGQSVSGNTPEQEQGFKLPPQIEEKLGKLDTFERALLAMAQRFEAEDKARQEAELNQTLDAELNRIYTSHKIPKETEPWLLSLLAQGVDGDTAAKQILGAIQAQVNQRAAAPAPNVLSGASLPGVQKPTTPGDRENAIVQFLNGMGR